MPRRAAVALVLLTAGCAHRPAAGTPPLAVAAAADLRFALDEIARDFRRANRGVDLRISYGSSGNFFSQIRNGAPFDVFLSADTDYPRRLEPPEPVFVYAIGRLAVWVPVASPLDPATALRSPALRKLAIANPRHAPYGRAAEAALRASGDYERLAGRLVLGENIAEVMEWARSGAADAGIVALSLALAPPLAGQGRYQELPADSYPAIEQGGAVLKPSAATRAFRAHLLGAQGRAVLARHGFHLPE
jgi:molybdate transport system substrate-binding protein